MGHNHALHVPGWQSGRFAGRRVSRNPRKEIADEMGHAKYLTDVIADLGGEPTTKPRDFDKPSELKQMIELDLKMEQQDVENYTRHAKMAEELGNTELKVKLEEMAADESAHARDLRRILRGL